MADTIQVTPQMLRSTANDIQANMEQAMGIAKGYLANQENVMNPATWSGAGVVASHMTATEITNELNKAHAPGRGPRAGRSPDGGTRGGLADSVSGAVRR